MLPRAQRITRGSDYVDVARHGRTFRGELIMLRTLRNASGRTRFGLVVSRAVGNSVVRNRTKRRLREILRGVPVHQGWDVVISTRPEAASASYFSLKSAVFSMLQRAELLTQSTHRTS
jgi:ribonuclease P protein component